MTKNTKDRIYPFFKENAKIIPRNFQKSEWYDFEERIIPLERFGYRSSPILLKKELLGWQVWLEKK